MMKEPQETFKRVSNMQKIKTIDLYLYPSLMENAMYHGFVKLLKMKQLIM